MLVEFADFELDDERFELRRRGARIAVQPKVLTLILHLVRNHERVVSVSELRAVLWPELAVGMTSLTRAVRGARLALGDSGASQEAIRTERRRGYRFALRVREANKADARLRGLHDGEKALLAIAARIGPAFSPALLSAISEMPAARLARCLEDAVARALEETPAGDSGSATFLSVHRKGQGMVRVARRGLDYGSHG
jgi:DNA-binding winged helix-turn-helix (wHTH) protein